MDRAEFQRYIDNALQKAERVRTYCTNDEIILVMTEDFYRELCALVEIPANRDVDNYGILFPYGYRIAVINEPTERTMVSPAMLGMTYHPYMALDDIIVVDEENRVFRLASRDPVQFTDTGMTVRFDAHTRFNKIFYEMKKRYNLRTAKEWLETEYNGGFYLHDASTSTYLPYCGVFDILTGGGRRKKNRIKEDAELSAGDTKAMDELLDGFAIKQNLQQA